MSAEQAQLRRAYLDVVARLASADDEMVDRLRPLITRALDTGERLPIGDSAWWLACDILDDRLQARLWDGDPAAGTPPHVQFTVMWTRNATRRPLLYGRIRSVAALQPAELERFMAVLKAADLEGFIVGLWIGLDGE